MTLSNLRDYVRQLTGVFSTDVVSDALINIWINEAYNELALLRDWDWLENTYVGTMPTFIGGKYTINLSGGTRRVISAYLVLNGAVTEMEQVPTLDIVEYSEAKAKYDVTYAGVFTFAPDQQVGTTIKVRYTQANVALPSDGSSPLFDGQFHNILAYRAAIKLLGFVSDDTPRSQYYSSEYGGMLEGMISFYELNHDDRAFQMGGDGQKLRKYYPWFRPA